MSEQLQTPDIDYRYTQLTNEVADSALDCVIKAEKESASEHRFFGVDHKNVYRFERDTIVGDPGSGYALYIKQNYDKNTDDVTNILSVSLVYGHDNPNHPESGEDYGYVVSFDISGDEFTVDAIKRQSVGSNLLIREELITELSERVGILEMFQAKLKTHMLLPTEIIEKIRANYEEGQRYDINKMLKSYEKKLKREERKKNREQGRWYNRPFRSLGAFVSRHMFEYAGGEPSTHENNR